MHLFIHIKKRLCSPVSWKLSVAVHVDGRHHHRFAQLPDVEVVDGLHPRDALDPLVEVRHADAGGCGLQQQQPVPAHLEGSAGGLAAAIKAVLFTTTSSLTCSMATAVSMITASNERVGSWSSRKAQTPELCRHLVPTVSMTRLWARASVALPRVCRTRASDRRRRGTASWSCDELRCSEVLAESRAPDGGDAVEKYINLFSL